MFFRKRMKTGLARLIVLFFVLSMAFTFNLLPVQAEDPINVSAKSSGGDGSGSGSGNGTSGGLTVEFNAIRTSPQDTLLQFDFSNGVDENLASSLSLIEIYEKSSGSRVNYSKYDYIKEGNKDNGGKLRRLEMYFDNLKSGTNYVVELGGGVEANNGSTLGTKQTFEFATSATEGTTLPEPIKPVLKLKDIMGHWAEEDIMGLVDSGAISGYPDGNFQPDKKITRAEFAFILVKALKLEAGTEKAFTDTANHWAENYIAAAAANGIVSGYSATEFGPDDNLTREQMAIMIVKAASLAETAEGKDFADSNLISPWAKKAITIASQNKIINGYPDNTIRPQTQASRAEAATVIAQALKLAS